MLAFPPRYVVGGDGRAIVLYAVFDHFSGGDTVSCANLLVIYSLFQTRHGDENP